MATVPSFFTDMKSALLDNGAVPVIQEMMRIFPDGLVITSGIYALLTVSFPFAIFFLAMLEATGLFYLIRWAASYINISPVGASRKSYSHICRTGFTDPSTSLLSLSMFQSDPITNSFPSSSIYMLTVASSYIFSTLNTQSKELTALGPAYASRYYISAIFLTCLIFLFVCFRIAYSCETFATVILTVPLGLFIGLLLTQQNLRLFGPEAMNLIGIPLLQSRTANGKKLYVCPK
jgi:hypothetical protein